MIKIILSKMRVSKPEEVQYELFDGEQSLLMNDYIGKKISLEHTGNKYCSVCDTSVKKFFGQGFCYPCFAKAPENSECIIRPELCLGHEGQGRNVEWEQKNHVQEHVVYLALTSAIKVGVTRKNNLVNRWIDQGAWKAIVLAEVPNRYLAGCIEVALKDFMTDKTNWRKMLKNEMNTEADLIEFKTGLIEKIPVGYQQYVSSLSEVTTINYPVQTYPEKLGSLNFDKTPEVSGVLVGIRGQYLIFEGGQVINIRKFTGYEIVFKSENTLGNSATQMSLF